METYIAILRGINVSGKNIIKMDQLVKSLSQLAFENISTYIQSGNIIFKCNIEDVGLIETQISQKIQQDFGYEVPAIAFSYIYLKSVSEQNPFVNDRRLESSFLYVTFLSALPLPELVSKLADFKSGNDEFIIKEKVIYLYCPDGYGNTKLSNTFFESKLKQKATTRNWKTVQALLKLGEV